MQISKSMVVSLVLFIGILSNFIYGELIGIKWSLDVSSKSRKNILEILKTLLIILFALSLVALTVRAVNFLDLIVENGYPIGVYFKYSILNIFGVAPKFIPLSFLLALTISVLLVLLFASAFSSSRLFLFLPSFSK